MKLGELVAYFKGNTQDFDRAAKRVQRQGQKMKKVGKQMSMGITAPLAIMGGVATKTFADFEAGMNQVKAVSGATGESFKQLEGLARQLGGTTKFSATEAAEGMNFLAMAGFEVDEIMSALPATLDLAAAGNMKLGRSADIVSNVMQGFAIDASRTQEVADILTKTFTSSNTSLEQLGEAMSYAAPVAKGFGQSIETTSAAVGLLSDAGIQASKAGTGLRRVFAYLSKKSDELGIRVFDAQGNMRDFANILADLEKQGMSSAEIMEIFGMRGGPMMQILLQRGADALKNFRGELENAGGTAKNVAETQLEGLKGAWIELQSALKELMISFINPLSSSIEGLVDKVKGWVQWLGNLNEATKKTIIRISGFAAAIGPLTLGLGYLLTNVFPGLIAMMRKAVKWLRVLTRAAVANPWIALATAIAGATAAIVAFSNKASPQEKLQSKLNEAANKATQEYKKQQAQLGVLRSRLKEASDEVKRHEEALAKAKKGSVEYRTKQKALEQAEERRKSIIKELNNNFGDYLQNEIDAKDAYKDISTQLDNVNRKLERRIELAAKQAISQEAFNQAVKARQKIIALEDEIESKQKSLTKVREEYNKTGDALDRKRAARMQRQINDLKDQKNQWVETQGAAQKEIKETESAIAELTEGVQDSTEKIKDSGEEAGEEVGKSVGGAMSQWIEKELTGISWKDFENEVLKISDGIVTWKENTEDLKGSLKELPSVMGPAVKKTNELARSMENASARNQIAIQKWGVAYESLTAKHKRFTDFIIRASSTIRNAVVDMAATAISGFGKMAVGAENATKAIAIPLLNTLAGVLERLGKMAIAVGIGIAGIKKALQSLNPAAAIAAGVALLALAGAVKAGAASLAESQKQEKVQSPSSKLQGLQSGTPEVTQAGLFEVGERGRETVYLPEGAAASPNKGQGLGQTVNIKPEFLEVGDKLYLHMKKQEQWKDNTY